MSGADVPEAGDVQGRRYALVVGVSRYADLPDLPGAAEEVERLFDVLAPMGYARVLPEVSADPTSAQLRTGLHRWTRTNRLGPDDVLFVYFAGHGAQYDGRQYLLCSDDGEEDFRHTALDANEFVGLATDRLAGHSLVIIDTCQSASTARDATRLALELGNDRPSGGRTWVIASFQDAEHAMSGLFARAQREVLTGRPDDRRRRFLSVQSVMGG